MKPAVCLLGLLSLSAAFAADSLDITSEWQCQTLDSKKLASTRAPKDVVPQPLEKSEKRLDADELIEDGGLNDEADPVALEAAPSKSSCGEGWEGKLFNLRGMLRQYPTDKYRVTGNPELDLNCVKKSNFNVWYRKRIDIPKDWQGSFVTFDVELQYVELALFVNGKLAGKGGAPSVRIDVTPFLRYGKPNELRVFFSSQGYGTGPGLRYQGRDETVQWHFESPVRLTRRQSAIVDGVWADTSVRKGEIALQYEIFSFAPQKVSLAAEIIEDEGRDRRGELVGENVVKRLSGAFDLVAGTNVVRLVAPWKDAKTWEFERPFLYNCSVTATDAKGTALACPKKFVFGFREVWREGRNVMLNGHVQHYRGFWGPTPKRLADIKKHGFNCIYATHQHESRWTENQQQMEELSRAGIAKLSGTPSIMACWRKMGDPVCQEQYGRFVRRWAASCRNWPCVHGASVGVNMMCAASWVMGARDFGRHRNEGPKGEFGIACRIAQAAHPNALYFAHGDGNIYDVATCNFYFNWVPLQEREEWYETWSKIGEIPTFPAEFGAPYYGSWFPQPGHAPMMTEHCAAYFGDRAYEAEDLRMLERSRDFAYASAGSYYSGFVDDGPGVKRTLYDFSPTGRELHRLLVERVTRSWRLWGQAFNPAYLDDMDWDTWQKGFELSSHRRYNGLCVAFIGGTPWHTDKTHAFVSGEKVEKSFAYAWDGFGDNVFKAVWEVREKATDKVIASGSIDTPMKANETKCVPFSFVAPKVAKRTSYVISAKFDARQIDETTIADSFEIEVYPARMENGESGTRKGGVALFDPRGESSAVLKRISLDFARVDSLDALLASKATHLVVGRRALDGGESNRVERLAAAAGEGRQVLVLAQTPDTWQKMGFKVEDSMPRQLWNTFVPGLDERDLSFWRGLPLPLRDGSAWQYNADWGAVQPRANGSRLWRWYHTHAVATEVFQVSTRTLYRPLVRGGCDMAYSPLMRAVMGKGSVTVCSLDFFRHRLGSNDYVPCPAAERTAAAVFTDFLSARAPAEAKVVTDGEQAARLAKTLGLEAVAWDGGRLTDAVLLMGKDAPHGWDEVKGALGDNARVLSVEGESFPKSAGLTLEVPRKKVGKWDSKVDDPYEKPSDLKPAKRATDIGDIGSDDEISLDEEPEKKKPRPSWVKTSDLPRKWVCTTNEVPVDYYTTHDTTAFGRFPFAGVGPQHLRWRFKMPIKRICPQKGWTVAGDGVFAISDDGRVLVDMMKPFELTDSRKAKKDTIGLYNVSLSQDNLLRRLSLVLMNWGVRPSAKLLERSMTVSPFPKGLKGAPPLSELYWTECPNADPYWFTLW